MKASQRLLYIEATYGDVIPRREYETLEKQFKVSTSAGRGSIPAQTRYITLGVKTWLSTLETVSLCISEEILKAVSPFYLVSLPGEVKDPTQGVNV